MRSLTTALLAAWLLLAAGPAAAGTGAAPTPASAPASAYGQQSEAAAIQDWLSRVAVWGQGYDAVTTSRSDTLLWMLDAPNALIDKLDSGSKAGAQAWVDTWAQQARQRLGADIEAYQRLSTAVPEFPRSIPMSAEHAERMETMAQAPDRTGALLISSGQASEVYIQLVERAASGRPEDMNRLASGIYVLMIATTEAENVMMEGLRGDRSEPNYHWRTAMIETNKALVAWMHHSSALLFEEPTDAAAVSAAIREHAANARSAARQMELMTDRVSSDMEANPALRGTELAAVLRRIFASIRQSAEVERRMAAELDALAGATLREDQPGVDASLARIETLTNDRIARDAERRQIMAQSPG
jgi:hypothetical protein